MASLRPRLSQATATAARPSSLWTAAPGSPRNRHTAVSGTPTPSAVTWPSRRVASRTGCAATSSPEACAAATSTTAPPGSSAGTSSRPACVASGTNDARPCSRSPCGDRSIRNGASASARYSASPGSAVATTTRRGAAHLLEDDGHLGKGGARAVQRRWQLQPEPPGPGQQPPVGRGAGALLPQQVARHGPQLVVDLGEVGHDQPTAGSLGRPRPRSPMIVRWISLVPPGIVHSQEPMKSSTHAPDSQPLEAGLRSSVCAGSPATSAPKPVIRCSSSL